MGCYSLELAEKISNYLNIREIHKSSDAWPQRLFRFGLMRRVARKDAGTGQKNGNAGIQTVAGNCSKSGTD
jgi:hypothetical protein